MERNFNASLICVSAWLHGPDHVGGDENDLTSDVSAGANYLCVCHGSSLYNGVDHHVDENFDHPFDHRLELEHRA